MKSTDVSTTNSIWRREAGDSEEQVCELDKGSPYTGLTWALYVAHGAIDGQSRTREHVQRWRTRIDMIHQCDINKLTGVESWQSLRRGNGGRETGGGAEVEEAEWDETGKGLFFTVPTSLTFGLGMARRQQKYSERHIQTSPLSGGTKQRRAPYRRGRWHASERAQRRRRTLKQRPAAIDVSGQQPNAQIGERQ